MNAKQLSEGQLLSIEELERGIVGLSARINSSGSELKALVHKLDAGTVPGLSQRAQQIIDEVVGDNSGDDTDNEINILSEVVNIPSAEG